MRILCDHHHADLLVSLQLLFEDRLGWELYRPIGMDWYHKGYWAVYPHVNTAQQYLGLDQASNTPLDIRGDPLSEEDCVNLSYTVENGIHYVKNASTRNRIQRGVTLEKFKDMKFDVLLSSMPPHVSMFNKLVGMYQSQAKHIFQVGNSWGQQPGVKNILASTSPFFTSNINVCFYHQEFDLNIFKYEPPTNRNVVQSFIHWMQKKELMNRYAHSLPGWKFKSYGAGLEDQVADLDSESSKMSSGAFAWHYKPGGDGYGHAIHRVCAVGRPPLIWGSQYANKLAGGLLEDQVTCIDMQKGTFDDNISLLKKFSQPEEHNKMCENTYLRFKQVVNFDEEEQKIRKFLEDLR